MVGMVVCRGLGTCGTCAVQVVGKVVPQEWGIQERLRFSFPPHHPSTSAHLRLACQVNWIPASLLSSSSLVPILTTWSCCSSLSINFMLPRSLAACWTIWEYVTWRDLPGCRFEWKRMSRWSSITNFGARYCMSEHFHILFRWDAFQVWACDISL